MLSSWPTLCPCLISCQLEPSQLPLNHIFCLRVIPVDVVSLFPSVFWREVSHQVSTLGLMARVRGWMKKWRWPSSVTHPLGPSICWGWNMQTPPWPAPPWARLLASGPALSLLDPERSKVSSLALVWPRPTQGWVSLLKATDQDSSAVKTKGTPNVLGVTSETFTSNIQISPPSATSLTLRQAVLGFSGIVPPACSSSDCLSPRDVTFLVPNHCLPWPRPSVPEPFVRQQDCLKLTSCPATPRCNPDLITFPFQKCLARPHLCSHIIHTAAYISVCGETTCLAEFSITQVLFFQSVAGSPLLWPRRSLCVSCHQWPSCVPVSSPLLKIHIYIYIYTFTVCHFWGHTVGQTDSGKLTVFPRICKLLLDVQTWLQLLCSCM